MFRPVRHGRQTGLARSTPLLALAPLAALLLTACGGGGDSGSATPASVSSMAKAAAFSPATECSPFQTPPVFSGRVQAPEAVLGFALGSREVSTDEANIYLDALDASSPRVVTGVAASSVQGRLLKYAIVGREDNVSPAGLDRLRRAARQLMDPNTSSATAAALAASTPAILWVAGNVHGNEESGADAALRVLYELADRDDCAAARILDNAVVVVLPIQNPDGRETDTRNNAYGFDMNRDWFARTQPETDGKLELLRQYPPVLFIDAHEMGSGKFFFPPYADPIYHEVPGQAFTWINSIYAAAVATEFDRQKIAYFHGAPYDLFAAEYGDTVPTIGFHAAGMTFEKYNGASIATRSREHYVAMWSSLFAGSSDKLRILTDWHLSHVEARAQGQAGQLQPNGIHYDAKTLYQQVPGLTVQHYFFPDDPGRARELAQLARRLQRMDVQVWKLSAPLSVPDYRAYGSPAASVTLPAGTWWIPMAQGRKHWIQAMLNEDAYTPVGVSYDVTAWSNPLLMNIAGGSSGASLNPQASLVPPLAAPALPGAPAGAPRIGLFAIPGTAGSESAGSMRYLFERVWGVPYAEVSAEQIKAGLSGIDVLLVPDGYAKGGLQALGTKGQKALLAWVEGGGRYVGYRGGTELAVGAGLSTAVLQATHTAAPGTLIRVALDPASPLAAGIPKATESTPTAWLMYDNDDLMSLGLGSTVARFPARGEPAFHTSGLAIGVDELAGSAAIVDEPVGNGRSVVFSFDPNFRAWPEGTQRILWNALYGANPVAAAASAKVRAAAIDTASRAAKALPDTGKAIRIVVQAADADTTRALLQSYGAEFKELRKTERTVFVIANREALSREEHPYVRDLARDLTQLITPISFSMP